MMIDVFLKRELEMRTTLMIEDDVFVAVKGLALAQHQSIGAVLSALARQSLRPNVVSGGVRNGVPLLVSAQSKSVTPKIVNQLRDELL